MIIFVKTVRSGQVGEKVALVMEYATSVLLGKSQYSAGGPSACTVVATEMLRRFVERGRHQLPPGGVDAVVDAVRRVVLYMTRLPPSNPPLSIHFYVLFRACQSRLFLNTGF